MVKIMKEEKQKRENEDDLLSPRTKRYLLLYAAGCLFFILFNEEGADAFLGDLIQAAFILSAPLLLPIFVLGGLTVAIMLIAVILGPVFRLFKLEKWTDKAFDLQPFEWIDKWFTRGEE